MNKFRLLSLLVAMTFATGIYVNAQIAFTPLDTNYTTQVVLTPVDMHSQVLFVGGHDSVQTLSGNALAKQWHDFIGFTPVPGDPYSGYVSVNHEMILADDKIGDGGGMTVFRVELDQNTDTLRVVGPYRNVDFSAVGSTGMNCGGISSPVDGRIWTAEEWFRTSNNSIYRSGTGILDTSDVTIAALGTAPAANEIFNDIPGSFSGSTIHKYQSLNYMVEIDPVNARAIRKQYNWGRQPFEGGVVMPDNKTVYLGPDATPSLFPRFVADNAGDFTKGQLSFYKQSEDGTTGSWIDVEVKGIEEAINIVATGLSQGATFFNRIEWVAQSPDGKIYFTETGRDQPGSRLKNGADAGGTLAKHHIELFRAQVNGDFDMLSDAQVEDSIYNATSYTYNDYFGRIVEFDPATNRLRPYLNGGPLWTDTTSYPEVHLSNPDGLNIMQVGNGTVGTKTYMIIQEDLNGTSNGRTPHGVSNRYCEMFLLDMDIANPTWSDLQRMAVTSPGAEITGACVAKFGPNGEKQWLLFNNQHPSSDNPFPHNNSHTVAMRIDDVTSLTEGGNFSDEDVFQIYPNPATRTLFFNRTTDAALYTANGQRVKVVRNAKQMDVSDLNPGYYFVQTIDGEVQKLIVK